MNQRLLSAVLAAAIAVAFGSCAPRRPADGFRPPPTQDPFAAYIANWVPLEAISGKYAVKFRYSDGQRVSLSADMVVEREARARVDLSSDRGAEAIVILTPERINLVNIHDRYNVREENTPENSERMVGLFLAPQEMAALLAGRGLDPQRFTQLFQDPADGGGIFLRGYHVNESLKVSAYVDAYGRLRSARFIDAATDDSLVEIRYYAFRFDRRIGIVWPGIMEIDLPRSGEAITFRASDVDVNPAGLDMEYIFTPREFGKRLRLEDVPPGPPLLYRSAKEYVK